MTVLTGRNTYFVLLIGASIFLHACGSTDKAKSVVISTQPEPQGEIVKSPIDSREYASMVLDNQLEIMLVSDPSIEKSAVALSVAVGSLQEPKEFGGLAHYLEHMLFLGTTSYPTVGDYSEFVSRHGGTQNAYTQLDHTNYMVAVNNDAYDEALSRFSGFFYEAILDESYADKERNAVHSEWTMKSPNDWVILEQLNGTTLNPAHPISQFNWGNLDSLVDKKDNKLQTALVDMYNTYYSANLMKGAMISNLPIAEMQKLAKQYFGKIPNKNTQRPTMTVPVAKPEHLKKVVHYIPQTEMKQLRINFVIENNALQFAVKPNGYVNYLLANEMPGTLASVLRDAGLSDAVYSNFDADEYGNAGSFTLYIDLTETGVQNRDKVMGAVLKYLGLLREKGVNPQYFNEIKQSLSNSFRFKEKTNDYNYAMKISADLQHIPAEYVLSSAYEYQRFNPQVIQAVLDQLTLDNARIFYIDKQQTAEQGMEYFAGKYTVHDINPELEQKWQQLSSQFALTLPRANSLMPESFDLVAAEHTGKPAQLVSEQGHTVHLGHSAMFKQPKGRVTLDLNSGLTKSTAKNHVLADLLDRGLGQQLTELQSEAGAAGMGLNVSLSNGLSLTASGFTDKQGMLLASTLKQILDFDMSESELANLKASFKSDIQSSKRQILLNQLFPKFSQVANLDEFSDEALLAEVDGILASDIQVFRDQLLKQATLRVFAFGNYSDQQVKQLSDLVLKQLPEERQVSDVYQTPLLQSEAGKIYSWQEDIEMTDVGLIDAYLAPRNDLDLAAARLLSQIIRPALFKQIRTEEQLAYAVGFFGQTFREQMLVAYYIQSPAKGLADVGDRIALFRKGFSKQLAAVTSEEFATTKNSVLITLTQPAKNLSEEMGKFIGDWRDQKWQFDSRDRLIAAIEKVTLDDVINLYNRIEGGKDFGQVLIQMRGTKFADQAFIEPEGAIKVTDIDSFHQQLSL
ncbi:insulinase family protein [Paraglaciecola sp. MB-3u-78]|uniref:insulinase family protein n=1 Tax=Paraglaciecola sp. MB-3u-78 TaxID=2058332 RepID=UPI000C3435EB|nr:insulinase family protein [Paraglaciecola sp. MB-3u-78]PKG96071.1 peptidase M16 [Paraglaciecola sp. MB-3u-78]